MLLVPPLLGGEPLSDILESDGAWDVDRSRHNGCSRLISQNLEVLPRILTGGSGDDGARYVRRFVLLG